MELLQYITFVIASVVLIVMPGPNVLVVVSTSISYGTKRGLQTVLGTSSAMAIQLIVAAFGTGWLVSSVVEGLGWLRWFGVAYLTYLGIKHLSMVTNTTNIENLQITGKGTFGRGFIVSLTNPKTILFFGAFLPQFVSPNGEYINQVIILSITFISLATLLDGLYAIMAGRLGNIVQSSWVNKVQNGVSGSLFIGVGVWLAATRMS